MIQFISIPKQKKRMLKQKILITGSTGFIGQNLVSKLGDNFEVSCLVRNANKANKILPKKTKQLIGTLASINIPKNTKYNVVIHAAANINLYGKKKDLLETNVKGTQNLINKIKNKCNLFMYLSTIEALDPKTWYGLSKRKAEKLILDAKKKDGLKTIILRLGNVTGPQKTFFFEQIEKKLKKQSGDIFHYYPLIKAKKLALLDVEQVAVTIKNLLKQNRSGVYTLVPPRFSTIEEIVKTISQIINQPIPQNKNSLFKKINLKIRLKKHQWSRKADLIDYLFNKASYQHLSKENIIYPAEPKELKELIKKTLRTNE
jgi:nucleoside-diphosphate-sugar epimerase